MGWLYFSSISRIIMRSSFFCSWLPWEKLSRKTSAPAKNSFSIISLVDEAGPSVTTCLVDLRHRCATLGTWATVVGLPYVAPPVGGA
jgi:hypothetical protein